MADETYEFCCDIVRETSDAYLVSDGENEYWIPRSQVKSENQIGNNEYELIIPEWLANEKGII